MTRQRAVVALVFALFALALLRLPGRPAANNADRSYRQVYAHFVGSDAQAGVDHVFNLGPLGHFALPVYDPDLYWLDVVTGTLLALLGSLALTALTFRRTASAWILAGVVPISLLVPRGGPEVAYSLAIVAATLLLLEEHPPQLPGFVLFGAVLGFLSIAKLNFLVLGCWSLAFVLADGARRRELGRASSAVAAMGLSAVVCWLAAGQQLASFPRWIAGSLEISRAYNLGMTVGGDSIEIAVGVAALALAAAVAFLPALGRPLRVRELGAAAFVAGFLLLQWKDSVIRQHAHMSQLLVPVLCLPLLLPVAPRDRPRTRRAQLACTVAAIAVALVGHARVQERTLVDELQVALHRAGERAASLLAPGSRRGRLDALRAELVERHALPRFRSLVGEGSVDIFPPFQGVVLLNDFAYRPRPVLQGYQATSAPLLRRNADFYAGPDAPDFVLYRLAPMDGRYPTLEDGLALRELFTRYRPVAREGGMLLLERDPEPRSQRETGEPLAGIARFGQWIEVPDSGGDWQLLRVDVPTSAWGEARAALYKLPQLRLTVRLDDGSIARHRVHPGPLSVPFLLSPYLERGSVAQGWPGGPPARRVEAFSLTLPRGGSAAFADEIAYELTAVSPLTEGSPPLQR